MERFTVKFETGGGTKIEDKIVLEGTLISTLDKPYWAEHIFVGWCYDAALKQPVASTDKVTGKRKQLRKQKKHTKSLELHFLLLQ